MIDPTTLLITALLLPLICALLVGVCRNAPVLRDAVTLVTSVLLAATVWLLLPHILAGARPSLLLGYITPKLSVAFTLEPLGMVFALVAGTLWSISSLYAIGYMRANKEPRLTTFFICFAVAIFATMGIAFAANLTTFFIFYEILTLSTYPLVTHAGTPAAMAAGRKYLGILLATSMGLLLPAIVITGQWAGTLDFVEGGSLDSNITPIFLSGLLVLFVFGIGKAAVMPVHFWLPAAMVAPTPVSALLHAVAVVKAGVFGIVKVVVYIFGLGLLARHSVFDWLTYVAGFTIIFASIIALLQDNLKKRLAYSTVSQLSYIVLAASLFTPAALIGAVLHICAHAVSKITLFFAAGNIYTVAHKTEVSQLNGIGRKMPYTMGAFAIGAIAMIGLPPTAGFLGKWFILSGAAGTQNNFAIFVIICSTLLNAAYFLPIIFRAFFMTASLDSHGKTTVTTAEDAPIFMLIAIMATATLTVLMFFFPDIPLSLARSMLGA